MRSIQTVLAIQALSCVVVVASAEERVAPASYSGEPIEGVVRAPISNAPIKGVIVVADWALDGVRVDPAPAEVLPRRIHIVETVTDEEGRFYFPGWGPRTVPVASKGFYRLDVFQPWLHFFRAGYYFDSERNASSQEEWRAFTSNPQSWTGSPVRTSTWSGKTIYLHRYASSDAEYIEHLQSHLGFFKGCNWTKVPRLTAEFIGEGERLRNVRGSNVILKLDDLAEGSGGIVCGSPRTILHPYLVQVPPPRPEGKSPESR